MSSGIHEIMATIFSGKPILMPVVQENIGVILHGYQYLKTRTNRICIALPPTDKIIIESKTQILDKTNISQKRYSLPDLIEIPKTYRRKILIFRKCQGPRYTINGTLSQGIQIYRAESTNKCQLVS